MNPSSKAAYAKDYRNSHLAEEKGNDYANIFSNSRWLRYCWEKEKNALDWIISSFGPNVPFHHLDFACGTGRILQHLISNSSSSTGIDVSRSMLAQAKIRCPEGHWLEGDLTVDPTLLNRKFDVITAFRFFPNAQPELRSQAIFQLASRLSPDGILILNNHQNASSTHCRLGNLIGKKWGWTQMRHREVIELAEDANLTLVNRLGIGVLPASAKNMIFPNSIHSGCDTLMNVIRMRETFSQNVIYTFKPNK